MSASVNRSTVVIEINTIELTVTAVAFSSESYPSSAREGSVNKRLLALFFLRGRLSCLFIFAKRDGVGESVWYTSKPWSRRTSSSFDRGMRMGELFELSIAFTMKVFNSFTPCIFLIWSYSMLWKDHIIFEWHVSSASYNRSAKTRPAFRSDLWDSWFMNHSDLSRW